MLKLCDYSWLAHLQDPSPLKWSSIKYIKKWQSDGELFLRGGASYVGMRYLKWASEFEAESNKLNQFEDELDVVQGFLMSLGF